MRVPDTASVVYFGKDLVKVAKGALIGLVEVAIEYKPSFCFADLQVL